MKARLYSVALIFTVLALFLSVHLQAYQVDGKWTPASYLYDYHTLTSSWQSAVSYGSSRWNISGSSFEWAPSTNGTIDRDITKTYLDGIGGSYAVTSKLVSSSGRITWMKMEFDSGDNWYTGTGTPTSSQLDLRSVAAHEFGHALGLDHTQSYNCTVSDSSKPTMCDYYAYGMTWMRSLQQDDRNGVLYLYPATSFQQNSLRVRDQVYTVHFDYTTIDTKDAIRSSDHVVHGVITDVSETKWNQDSGEYWEDFSADGTTRYMALPYFTITLSQSSDLTEYHHSPLAQDILITVLGISPLEAGEDHNFHVGNELITLVRHTKLVWRNGRRPILQFVGDPAQSHFRKAGDGRFYRPSDPDKERLTIDELQNLAQRIQFAPGEE